MTVPLPTISVGACFVHGRYRSGGAIVANILTTEFSTGTEGVTPGSAGFAFAVGEFSMLGAGELGGSAVSVGAE